MFLYEISKKIFKNGGKNGPQIPGKDLRADTSTVKKAPLGYA
jgi:hypothetical protein